MPLFVVFFARITLKERQTTHVYLSLIPIIMGVAIATLTELSFNFGGLLCALLSTGIYSVLNVFIKKVQFFFVWNRENLKLFFLQIGKLRCAYSNLSNCRFFLFFTKQY